MRYTEYEFTVDHIFDLIRIAFSSVFLAPLRLVSEITKKVMYIEKSKIVKCCGISLGIGLSLLVADLCMCLAHKTIYLYEGSTPVISEVIAIFLLGCIYYASTVYDQPSVSYNCKPKQRKRPKVEVDTVLDEEDLIEDDIEEVTEIEREEHKEEPKENDKPIQLVIPKENKEDMQTSKPSRISLASAGLNINVNLPNLEDLPDDDVPITTACDNAEQEDIFDIVNNVADDLSSPPTIPTINKSDTFNGEKINQFAQYADIAKNLDPNKNVIDF